MLKKVALAVAAALAAQAACAASIDFHGYIRSQVGTTDQGGNLQCFSLNYPMQAKYRLGNECDNYSELAFDTKLYKGTDGMWSNYHLRLGLREQGAQDFEAVGGAGHVTTGDSENNARYFQEEPSRFQFSSRENWVEAGGFFGNMPFLKDAKVWVGKRFYNRNDVHINDYYYWANTGQGAGIENMTAGPVKFAIAYIQNGGNSSLDGAPRDFIFDNLGQGTVITPGTDCGGSLCNGRYFYRLNAVKKWELRAYDIPLWTNGKLELAAQIIKGDNTLVYAHADGNQPWTRWTFNDVSQDDPANTTGYLYTAQYTQSALLGGFNKLAIQYGTGNGAGRNWVPAYAHATDNEDDEVLRIVEQLTIAPTKFISGQATFIWEKQDNADGSGSEWTSFGVRPLFNFSENFGVAAELGMDWAKGCESGCDTEEMTKFTIAPQLSAGPGFWARPVFRLFGTYATWNDAARGSVNAMTNGVWYGKKKGITYGAQVEAWW